MAFLITVVTSNLGNALSKALAIMLFLLLAIYDLSSISSSCNGTIVLSFLSILLFLVSFSLLYLAFLPFTFLASILYSTWLALFWPYEDAPDFWAFLCWLWELILIFKSDFPLKHLLSRWVILRILGPDVINKHIRFP